VQRPGAPGAGADVDRHRAGRDHLLAGGRLPVVDDRRQRPGGGRHRGPSARGRGTGQEGAAPVNALLPLMVALPLGAAALAVVFGRWRTVQWVIAVVTIGLTLAMAVVILVHVD